MQTGDTIAAISSAVGPAARMILRLGGPRAEEIARGLVDQMPAAGGASRARCGFHGLSFPIWIYFFAGPRSYSGEDLVEFHIPGSVVLAKMLLTELLSRGARLAEAGEFTARAYFNGRIDLTEAEGVAATIAAGSERELAAARQLLAGELARRLSPILDLLADTLALIEVGIDFSDEDVTFLSAQQTAERIARVVGELDRLLSESVRFERLAHEPRVVLVGRPNAGKSTLLNALAGRERAVVSPIAGTTRDVLSVELPLERRMVRLMDVAGIEEPSEGSSARESATTEQDRIDRLMREHALRAVESADVVLLVIEATDSRPPLELPRSAAWIVHTKTDLVESLTIEPSREIAVSARSGAGMKELAELIDRLAFGGDSKGSSLALNARHVSALEAARAALARAAAALEAGPELIAMDLREALDALGSITGQISPDDLLGRIFSAFCIGK
jgi:tRNA modification GTPase